MRRDMVYGWLQARPLVPDTVLAAVLFVIFGLSSALTFDPRLPHLALGVAIYGALAFRRVRPVESFAAVAVAGLVQWAAGIDLTPADAGVLLALYSISAYGPRWASRAGLAVGILGAVLANQRYVLGNGGTGSFLIGLGLYSAAVVGFWALGDVRRVRQAYLAELVDRAKQAERERDQRAQIAAADERARIAREMHDIIAHNLSVVVAQADGGRYAAARDPAAAAKALDTIASTGRGALAEMRRLLGILRADDDASSERVPQPGLNDVEGLVESFRDAGLQVDLDITGTVSDVSHGASLAAYRAIQEALTNVLKHAGPHAHAHVALTHHDDRVEVVVADNGRGAATAFDSSGQGMGLTGMEERLALYRGRVNAGPSVGGGWRVAVTMPVNGSVGQISDDDDDAERRGVEGNR
jgi:signal transduction histidine kinase